MGNLGGHKEGARNSCKPDSECREGKKGTSILALFSEQDSASKIES